MSTSDQKHFFQKSPKRRIHELDYARNVAQHIIADKQSIMLNESLFNAKVAARFQTTLIKDVHKDVKSALRKYDSFVCKNESIRKSTDYQPLSSKNIKPMFVEKDYVMDKVKQHQILPQKQLTQARQQYEDDRREVVFKPEPEKIKNEIFRADNITPIKQDSTIFDWRRVQHNQSTPPLFDSTTRSSEQRRVSSSKGSYKKLHIQQANAIAGGTFSRPQTSRVSAIATRNTEWKQRVQEKISSEQQKKAEKEMKDCTFKPKITEQGQKKLYNKSVSKEFQIEIKEFMHLIDDLNSFKAKHQQKKNNE